MEQDKEGLVGGTLSDKGNEDCGVRIWSGKMGSVGRAEVGDPEMLGFARTWGLSNKTGSGLFSSNILALIDVFLCL